MSDSLTRRAIVSAAALAAALGCVNPGSGKVVSARVDLTDTPSGAATDYVGEIEAFALMQASADGTYWYNLSADLVDAPGGARVAGPTGPDAPLLRLGGGQFARVVLRDTTRTPLHQQGVLPPDTYRYLRLLLSPQLPSSSSMPPTKVRLSGTVGGTYYANELLTVTATTQIVQREIPPLALGDGARVRFEWDFNSETWLTPTALATKSIDVEAVKAAITVRIEH